MNAATIAVLIAASALAQTPATRAVPATPAQPPVPSPSALKYPPLREVKIPDIASFKLPNGIRVYLLENHELPLVSGTALVRTGNLFEPPDKIGLAGLTGSLMRTGGTRVKTGDELDEQLENIAASVESAIGETSGSVSFSCLKENTDEVLAVFHDVMTEPEFRPDKLALAKLRMRSGILRRNDDADSIVNREYARYVYGPDSPYGWRMELANLENIQRDDLIQFYRRYFFPENVMLAVYGDFEPAAMRARIEQVFGTWNHTQPPVPAFPEVQRQDNSGIHFASKEDVNQTFFELGHLGGILKDKDTPALQIMADILGGGFSSRLFQRVRTKLGYAYGIGASWGVDYNHPGLFEISGSTKSETTVDTLRAVREEIERMRTSPVTDQELKTAKDTVLNSFVFAFDTPAKTLSRILRYEYFGYPRDFIFEYQKAIAAVTKEDVLRVAKQYLHAERITTVAVGNEKELGKPLTELGPVKPIDLTIPEPAKKPAARPESQ
jgi:zinc protease